MNGIVAMSLNRVIGKNNKIPWSIKEDLQFFKKKTYGYPLVMGRKTFDSVGMLRGRHIYIVSNQKTLWGKKTHDKNEAASSEYLSSQEFVLDRKLANIKNIWVCGGAEIYRLLLPWIDNFYVTVVNNVYSGDTYMPLFENMYYNCSIEFESTTHKVLKYTR